MKTLVLIDNDALSRALIAQCLTGQGWRILEAEDGETGLEMIEKNAPAAVICDLRTPKRNGFKVCRVIREQPHLKSMRVLLTGVSRFANDRDTAFATGADNYLVKPIVPADLLTALDKCEGNEVAEKAAKPIVTGPTLVRFWGVRGSIPTPGIQTAMFGGNTSCVEVRVGEQILILDAGSGIRALGQSLMREFRNKPLEITMLVTHTHWDHIQGFPFFIPAYNPKVDVRIVGYEGAMHGLRSALFEQMQSAFFPVGLNQMASHVTFEELSEMEFQLGAVRVRSMFANHPGICLGYRLTTPNGDIVYMPDHEAYERHEIERQKLTGETSPRSLDYARLQDEKVIDFIREADVVIGDTQYDRVEYPTRLGWGHTCADDAVELAMRAGVKHLFLFHHDPDHHDDKMVGMITEAEQRVAAAGSSLIVSAAREGAEIVL
ncbi:MAG TPA: response regulator [Chthoniobacterales bacterium]|jgi:phosphoribosyl 1,2-cyclic phosphodiesterase/ActR/RegA family two-component response regulator|nr:response regulator [Chthoniobacterales bacterium]